jgi:predicted TPR repeat methyltransferase
MPTSSEAATEAPDDATTQTLRQAMQEHGAGRFDAAQALYEQVLAAAPAQPDALHLLGVLEAQRGRHDSAAGLIGRAIAAHPGEAMFHNNLGNVCIERGRFDEAEACYMRAIELDPGRLDALNNVGVLLSRREQPEGAEKLLLRVIELAPDFADARQNLANHYMRQGRLADAVQQCFDGLIVAPRSNAMRRILGLAYSMMGMKAEAAAVYRAWIAAEPGNPVPEFHLAACIGEAVPERAPDAYVARVFDNFARTFDAKLAELGYKAPELVVQAVARQLAPPAGVLDVLDAGCGTGLCGPLLAPWARHLGGVDLSAGMLHKAVARQVYDELAQGELVAFIAGRPGAYDLIVSADTIIYFGRLDGFLAAAAAALRSGGLLVFTLEAHADAQADHRLNEHGRYSHRRCYVESALRDAGFVVMELQTVVLRSEAGAPVEGWLVAGRTA